MTWFALRRPASVLGLIVGFGLLLVVASSSSAYARTVAPPPPWTPNNASEMMSRAASAVGSDYKWGYESWVAQAGSQDGPDCSGLVLKSWEVPDTVWFLEEDGSPRGPNIDWDSKRYTTGEFYTSGSYWNSVTWNTRKMGDATTNAAINHMVLIHDKDYYGSGYDRVFEAPATGYTIRHGSKNTNGWYVTRRTYLEAYSADTHILDNPSAGQTGPDNLIGWRLSTSNTPYSGENYQFVYANETAHARWVPWIETTGWYSVYARYSTAASRTAKADYQIHYSGGSRTVRVDQRSNDGTGNWKYLGVFYFARGWDKYNGAIDLYAPTDEGSSRNIVIDAVKLVPNGW